MLAQTCIYKLPFYSVQSAKVSTSNDRIRDIFSVVDSETKRAIPEEKWSMIKEKVLISLKHRKSQESKLEDPLLLDQVGSVSCFFVYVQGYGGKSLSFISLSDEK